VRRGRVGLLQGCVQRVFFSQVNDASARVLAAEGYDVVAPERPRCCGALHLHTGYEDGARRLAKETMEQFEGFDYVAANAAGCGSAMKGYGHLFEDDPTWAGPAAAFAARVRDVSELLAGEPRAPRHPLPLRVAYHDACHLAHAQAVRAEPRALLRTVPGLELVEPDEWEICCGSAGVYNVLQPEAASELGRRKATNLLATGAEAIAGCNPGCTLQIASHLKAVGSPLPVYHPVELVRMSIEGGNGARAS
jgi:glycolate oxidase iron-sulfur subunit